MKVIIIGTSLAGKTTLIRALRLKTDLPSREISEMDEQLTDLNFGEYPTGQYKQVLVPQIIDGILEAESMIFFTNTDYFGIDDLKKAKANGFKIVQLEISLEDLFARNKERIEKQGYDDMSRWLPGMVEYQAKIRELGLVDQIIDATGSTNEILKQIIEPEKS